MLKFEKFLAQRGQNYQRIDRLMIFRIFDKYGPHFPLKKTIQIIGTNGKGSTGRFAAQLLAGLGCFVGHFTSPHLLDFAERFYLARPQGPGRHPSPAELEAAHEALAGILGPDLARLSYFEYATLLGAWLFRDCDLVLLEAGVGAEYDATSVFAPELNIYTRIDLDHRQILGPSLTQIARTKLKTMAPRAIISAKQDPAVLDLAGKIAWLRGSELQICPCAEATQAAKVGEGVRAAKVGEDAGELGRALRDYAEDFALPGFLRHNLALAAGALELYFPPERIATALGKMGRLDLPGRCEEISPGIFIDVGHNELAARALAGHFAGQKIRLIYNSYADKDVGGILKILKNIIDILFLFHCEEDGRAFANEGVRAEAGRLGISCEDFSPELLTEILAEPREETDEEPGEAADGQGGAGRPVLVFGSFAVVEGFLKLWRGRAW